MFNQKKIENMTSREIIEFIVLEVEYLKDKRDWKYYLGEIVSKNILNESEVCFKKEKLNYKRP